MKAVKANKVYTISEAEKSRYLVDGFDIIDDDGIVLEYAKNKHVSYEEYKALEEKLQTALEELQTLKTAQEKGKK